MRRFIDRERELAALRERLRRPSSFSLIYGPRRAGKSYLLEHALADEPATVYFQADEGTAASLLARFRENVARTGLGGPAWQHLQPGDWGSALTALVEGTVAGGQPGILVLDEVQYLIEAEPALPSILQRIWDQTRNRGRLHIVLCGSAMGTLGALGEVGQPLHGRFDLRIKVQPFDYFDAARFAPGWTAADRLRLFGVFGGLGRHLAEVDPERSLADNAVRAFVDSLGPLHEAPLDILRSERLSDAPAAHAIVSAIAGGESRFNAIAARAGLRGDRADRVLKELVSLDIATREVRFGDRPGSRYTRYWLVDPFMTFWFRHVRPLQSALLGTSPQRLWSERIEPRLDDHMGPVFERIVAQALLRGRVLDRIGTVDQVASWWSRDASTEIDLVVQAGPDAGRSERWYIECKWRANGQLDLDALHQLRRQVGESPLGAGRLGLATAGQISDALRSTASREGIMLIDAADLLGTVP